MGYSHKISQHISNGSTNHWKILLQLSMYASTGHCQSNIKPARVPAAICDYVATNMCPMLDYIRLPVSHRWITGPLPLSMVHLCIVHG